MGRTYTVAGRTYYARAWTGGDTPPDLRYVHSRVQGRQVRTLDAIRVAMYREQINDWREYWGDLPDSDTRSIFWRRATYDAWRTITQ